MSLFNKKLFTIIFFILLSLFLFLLFYHINHVPFASSDESRHGVSALEMIYNHNYIVNSWAGQPDMWNLKPILSFLPTCLFILLFGKSILTIRLFSILSAIILCGLTCFYTFKKYNIYTSVLFIALLFTTSLLTRNHAFRSGDIDSFFILCQVATVLSLASKNNIQHLVLATFISSLAFLAKSWHVFFMGIPYIIAYGYLIKTKQFNFKAIFLPFLSFIAPILVWLALRYPYDGFAFIKAMYQVDLIQRSSHMIENHIHGHGYYLSILINNFGIIFFTFVFSLIYSFYLRKKQFLTYDIVIFLSAIFSSLLIYSLAKTKLYHYGYTHLILLCLVTSILIGRDINPYTKILSFIFSILAIIFAYGNFHKINSIHLPPYYQQLQKNAFPKFKTLYIPQHIEQNERLAFMVFGNFNYNTIKQGKPDQQSLVFYRKGSNDDPDITQCHSLSPEIQWKENKQIQKAIILYSCKK